VSCRRTPSRFDADYLCDKLRGQLSLLGEQADAIFNWRSFQRMRLFKEIGTTATVMRCEFASAMQEMWLGVPANGSKRHRSHEMQAVRVISLILLIVGGLNWGLIGVFDFNLVEAIFGQASRLIYAIVGVAAVYEAINLSVSGETARLTNR
jgi:uncharacterized protein